MATASGAIGGADVIFGWVEVRLVGGATAVVVDLEGVVLIVRGVEVFEVVEVPVISVVFVEVEVEAVVVVDLVAVEEVVEIAVSLPKTPSNSICCFMSWTMTVKSRTQTLSAPIKKYLIRC